MLKETAKNLECEIQKLEQGAIQPLPDLGVYGRPKFGESYYDSEGDKISWLEANKYNEFQYIFGRCHELEEHVEVYRRNNELHTRLLELQGDYRPVWNDGTFKSCLVWDKRENRPAMHREHTYVHPNTVYLLNDEVLKTIEAEFTYQEIYNYCKWGVRR